MDRILAPVEIDKSQYLGNVVDLEAKYGLPVDVEFCKSCVISNQRPNSAVEYNHTKDSKKTTINFDDEAFVMPVDLQREKHLVLIGTIEKRSCVSFLIATVVQTVVTIVWFQVQVEKIAFMHLTFCVLSTVCTLLL